MSQEQIQELSTKLQNIEDVNQHKKELENYRKMYKTALLKLIENIQLAKHEAYIRWHETYNKFNNYYGHQLSFISNEQYIKIMNTDSNFFYFKRTCFDVNTDLEKCYTHLPSEFFEGNHSTLFQTYKGLGLHFNDKHDLAMIYSEKAKFVKIAQTSLEKVMNDFANHINKYAERIYFHCENSNIFGYDNIQTCKNEVYEPIKNLDY